MSMNQGLANAAVSMNQGLANAAEEAAAFAADRWANAAADLEAMARQQGMAYQRDPSGLRGQATSFNLSSVIGEQLAWYTNAAIDPECIARQQEAAWSNHIARADRLKRMAIHAIKHQPFFR